MGKLKIVKANGKQVKHRRISDMRLFETGYAVPWAVNDDGTIDTSFSIYPEPCGTCDMKVTRVLKGVKIKYQERE